MEPDTRPIALPAVFFAVPGEKLGYSLRNGDLWTNQIVSIGSSSPMQVTEINKTPSAE